MSNIGIIITAMEKVKKSSIGDQLQSNNKLLEAMTGLLQWKQWGKLKLH